MPEVEAFGARPHISWRNGALSQEQRFVATETAIALSYGGSTHAVMMATPQDLADFAIGFSLTEGLVAHRREIRSLDVCRNQYGIDLQMWLDGHRSEAFSARRRAIFGPAGCGLCGVESLAASQRPLPRLHDTSRFEALALLSAMDTLQGLQRLNRHTRAMHAAAWWQPKKGLIDLREDVGRHNALDKLVGAAACREVTLDRGAVLLTSRVSVEMVQKAAMVGVPVIVAVSAPTSLAIETAEEAGITLAAIARSDGFDVFSHCQRISF